MRPMPSTDTLQPSTSVITESAIKTFGQLDGLVLNHGTLEPLGRLENAKIDEWIQAYNTNLFSCLSLVGLQRLHFQRHCTDI